MCDRPLRILQVNKYDEMGGAARAAWTLFEAYHQLGHTSWLSVGDKRSGSDRVYRLAGDEARSGWSRGVRRMSATLCNGGTWQSRAGRVLGWAAEPRRMLEYSLGWEDFNFPGTSGLVDALPAPPDVIHCHNLHGGYFDLRRLPRLSTTVPVVLTLHDAWLTTGHCSHSFECDGWQTGCGRCPDLEIYPSVRRDATAFNVVRKARLYRRSRFAVTAPCRWLLDRARRSILAPAIVDSRVIPYGLDLTVFSPGHRAEARHALGLPVGSRVLLFVATGIRDNRFKDYETLRRAIEQVATRWDGPPLILLAVGEEGKAISAGRAEIRFVSYMSEPGQLARYYRAADVYVHAAKIDTFPNSILEALACGTPVVATAVGGIPEQVDHGRTGYLTPASDVPAMAHAIETVLNDTAMRSAFSTSAVLAAQRRFDISDRAREHIDWYTGLMKLWRKAPSRVA